MAHTIWNQVYEKNGGTYGTNDPNNKAAWDAAWEAYWNADPGTRDNEYVLGNVWNNLDSSYEDNNYWPGGDQDRLAEAKQDELPIMNKTKDLSNYTAGIPQAAKDENRNNKNYFDEEDINPSIENSMQKYWDTANKQAVQNYAKANKFGNDIGNVFNDNGDINWGWLEENNFWNNADGSKKSLKQIYGDNGVTYDSILNDISNLADRANINNERALSAMGPNRNGQAQDFYTRDTRNGENFTNADKQIMSAQLQGIDYLKDVNPALYNQLESQMVDTSGGRQLKGQDLADMEYGYDATEGTYGNKDTSLNGLTAEQAANYLFDNQVDLSQAIANNQLADIFTNADSDLNSLKTVTDKMTNAGLSLKNPNGRVDDDQYMKDNPQTYESLKKWLSKYKEKGANTETQDALVDYNKDLDAAQLNAAIIASAAAAENNALKSSLDGKTRDINQFLLNDILSQKDRWGNTFIGGDIPQYEYGTPDTNSQFNLENLGKKTRSAVPNAKLALGNNGRDRYWTESNNLFNKDIENALKRIGLRRR